MNWNEQDRREDIGLTEAISSGAGVFHSGAGDHGVRGGLLSWGIPRGARRPAGSQQLS